MNPNPTEQPAAEPEPRQARPPKRQLLRKSDLDDILRVRPHEQHSIWDIDETGLSVLVSRGPKSKRQGTVTFRVVYYPKPGKPRYLKLGRYPDGTFRYGDRTYSCAEIQDMRDAARQIRMDAKKGLDPKKPRLSGNFAEVVQLFLNEHANRTRTFKQAERLLRVYVVPRWDGMNIEAIKKGDISALLQDIADGKIKHNDRRTHRKTIGTPAIADAVRARVVALFNWYARKYGSDDFRPPLVFADKSWKPTARERCLNDDEIRVLWRATESMGAYGALIRIALLTAQRFRKVGAMRRSQLVRYVEVAGERIPGDFWDATSEKDPKNKRVSVVPLSPLARRIIDAVPVIDSTRPFHSDDLVFDAGWGALEGAGNTKGRLDSRMLAIMRQEAEARGEDPNAVTLKPWQHRDLRRTARTLMTRLGVNSDVAEHCLGHVPPGVRGIYDRYHHLPAKRAAFESLAGFIERLVEPPGTNVFGFDRTAARTA